MFSNIVISEGEIPLAWRRAKDRVKRLTISKPESCNISIETLTSPVRHVDALDKKPGAGEFVSDGGITCPSIPAPPGSCWFSAIICDAFCVSSQLGHTHGLPFRVSNQVMTFLSKRASYAFIASKSASANVAGTNHPPQFGIVTPMSRASLLKCRASLFKLPFRNQVSKSRSSSV